MDTPRLRRNVPRLRVGCDDPGTPFFANVRVIHGGTDFAVPPRLQYRTAAGFTVLGGFCGFPPRFRYRNGGDFFGTGRVSCGHDKSCPYMRIIGRCLSSGRPSPSRLAVVEFRGWTRRYILDSCSATPPLLLASPCHLPQRGRQGGGGSLPGVRALGSPSGGVVESRETERVDPSAFTCRAPTKPAHGSGMGVGTRLVVSAVFAIGYRRR